MRQGICFALLAALPACGPSMQSDSASPAIQLATEPSSAAPGDTLTLILTNASQEAIGYNLCSSGLERRQGTDWQVVPSNRVCTMELRVLEPGDQATFPVDVPDTLSTGEYRFTTSVDLFDSGGREGLASEAFSVAR